MVGHPPAAGNVTAATAEDAGRHHNVLVRALYTPRRTPRRIESGVTGTFEANWAAAGRRMQLAFEVTGTRGAIAFTQERMNELHLHSAGSAGGRQGFTRIEAGPEHPPYGNICPAGGHQLGFNELKIIEVAELLDALAGGPPAYPDFEEGYQVQRTVDAVKRSAGERCWIDVASL